MCKLYSITANQAAIINLFRVVNRYVGNLAPMPGVFPGCPTPVIRSTDHGTEFAMMRWGMPPPPPRTTGFPRSNCAGRCCRRSSMPSLRLSVLPGCDQDAARMR
jgi:putative SOS response-associated peptidase YedK